MASGIKGVNFLFEFSAAKNNKLQQCSSLAWMSILWSLATKVMNVWAIFLNYEYKYLHVYANKMNIHNIRKKSLDTSHGFVKSPQEPWSSLYHPGAMWTDERRSNEVTNLTVVLSMALGTWHLHGAKHSRSFPILGLTWHCNALHPRASNPSTAGRRAESRTLKTFLRSQSSTRKSVPFGIRLRRALVGLSGLAASADCVQNGCENARGTGHRVDAEAHQRCLQHCNTPASPVAPFLW